ncbi:MAG: tRNA uridine(34) 5-carboxymethylaminomethyl modification radical SAM/GNAT enzyme Elp3 [Parcubacteria group bacterium]|nr:tRNA uridine(34) 5-carboxymethylaminomethyl modification radical SAM/GNAT enzyme Elp3 [Parcubacteria group bacterium]
MSFLHTKIIYAILAQKPADNQGLLAIIRHELKNLKIPMPTKTDLWKEYQRLIAEKQVERDKSIENLLKRRSVRTLSGVAPITVMTAPLSCPKRCVYCPTERNMPKSYLSNQPAAMRAILSDFDPYKQTATRLHALQQNGHATDKIEIIINGGTWSAHPKYYQTWYIKRIFDACNNYDKSSPAKEDFDPKLVKTTIRNKLLSPFIKDLQLYSQNDSELIPQLLEAQKINETADNRIIGITLETRPDYITPQELARMRMLGATKAEIGVQTLYDDVVTLNRREQSLEDIIRATKLLKDAGFKVAYHMMPNMYGSTPERDIAMFKELFENPSFRPDFLKIYPCVVVKESELYEIYKRGDFKPYSTEALIETLIAIKQYIPQYCRISRLSRDIPSDSIEGGCPITNLREIIQGKMTERGLRCQCIRCREAKQAVVDTSQAVLNIQELEASGSKEFFLSFDSPDRRYLYAFLRLRLPNETSREITDILPELTGAAHVRELHTYGKLVPLSKTEGSAVQHIGFGKRLMQKAEEIAASRGVTKMAVIAGIGVREYYKKLGYHLDISRFGVEGTYMVKNLK